MNTNQPKDESTPRPWQQTGGEVRSLDRGGRLIAACDIGIQTKREEDAANAALIVSAVNQFDALRAVAEAAKALLWPNVPSGDDVALMIRCTGTAKSQEKALPLAEKLSEAQSKMRKALALLAAI